MVLNFDNIQSYRIALDDGLTIELMVINVMINVKPKLTLDLRNAKKITVHPMKALVIKKLSIDHSLLIGNKQKPNL
jgi:hypothetical protein